MPKPDGKFPRGIEVAQPEHEVRDEAALSDVVSPLSGYTKLPSMQRLGLHMTGGNTRQPETDSIVDAPLIYLARPAWPRKNPFRL